MILHGDALTVLRTLDAGSVQTCVTSPPYFGLRDYGVKGQIGLEPTPEAYVARLVEVFREVRRILKPTGVLWLNLGDSYAGSSQTGKNNLNESAASTRGGAKKIDAVRFAIPRPVPTGLKPKDLIGIPWRVAFALQADGWYLRSDIIWAKPNPMPESVRDRPTKAHEYLFLLAKSAKYLYDADAIKEPTINQNVRGPAERHVSINSGGNSGLSRRAITATRNRRTVWTVTPRPFKGAHFATFPAALVEPCILAGSRPGDTVLDPFSGAGTTALVASQLGRRGLGIELNPEYIKLAEARLAA